MLLMAVRSEEQSKAKYPKVPEGHRAHRGVLRGPRSAIRRRLPVASRLFADRVWMRRKASPYLHHKHLQQVWSRPRGRRPRRVSRTVFGGRGPSSVAQCREARRARATLLKPFQQKDRKGGGRS